MAAGPMNLLLTRFGSPKPSRPQPGPLDMSLIRDIAPHGDSPRCWAALSTDHSLPCDRPSVDDDLGLCERHIAELRI